MMAKTQVAVMVTGYAYELDGADWRGSSDEAWETVVYTATLNERLVGGRFIDGAQVRVFVCQDGVYRAQTKACIG